MNPKKERYLLISADYLKKSKQNMMKNEAFSYLMTMKEKKI